MAVENKISHREAMTKALVWRLVFSIPPGALITWLWMGNPWKSLSLMVFLNVLYTFIHYFFEKTFWPKFWKLFDEEKE
tara:strand:- start:155 stop:388 length:234 start_codon:yes stop_codon:yes gene_type:complete